MTSELIVLKLRNEEALAVKPEILTSHSPVFRRIIHHDLQTEHEMDDFSPEAVTIFVTSLDSGVLDIKIERALFRDLNKLAAVFEVSWMVETCRKYLEELIDSASGMGCDDVIILIEECMFIKKRWKKNRYINLLIRKIRYGNYSSVIRKYMKNFSDLSEIELDLVLKIVGFNTSALLNLIKRNLEDDAGFHKSIKYLLENVNLRLCMEQNNETYHEIFDILSTKDLSLEDTKLVFKLHRESTKNYFFIKKTNPPGRELSFYVCNKKMGLALPAPPKTDIVEYVLAIVLADTSSPTDLHIYTFIDWVLAFAAQYPELLKEQDPAASVVKIEKTCVDHGWRKVSSHYMDDILSFENPWNIGNKFKDMLDAMRNSEILTSYSGSMELVSSPLLSLTFKDFLSKGHTFRFSFKHPAIIECTRPGNCGFILKTSLGRSSSLNVKPFPTSRSKSVKIKLCTEEAEYPTHLHYHDIVRQEHMAIYITLVHVHHDGTRARYPVQLWNWYHRNEEAAVETQAEVHEICVCYDVSEYLAVKV